MSGDGPPLIVHVIHRLDFGGLENGLVNLVNRLPTDRYRHAILCLSGINPDYRNRIQRPDVVVESLNKLPGKDPAVYARMWRVLRRLRPAIVHTRNLGTVDMQWIALAAAVRRRIHGEHGWEATDPNGLNPNGLRIRRACRPVIHRYVPMSRDIAQWLRSSIGVDERKIRQLYSGVDTEQFRPLSKQSAVRPSEERIKDDSLTIGTVGRLDPVKNQSSLLSTLASLRRRHPSVRLMVVGDGPLRASLEAQSATLGVDEQVLFTGARNDTPDLMRSFDVFALPSINEGISNTILEAMATGLPVVAARVGGNPELVVDGVTGRLYESDDPTGLEKALLPYLTDPGLRKDHGAAGRERVVQNFSLDAMVQRYLALYDELLAEK